MKNIEIIGAGLSGLYAAKTAAINGAKVIVFERKKEVGSVLKCGEMFTTIYGMPPAKCIVRDINEWIFDFSLVKELERPGIITMKLPPGFAVMTDRATHEKIIYEECVKLGVEFVFGRSATLNDLYNDCNIIASGCHSLNRRAYAKCFTVKCDQYSKHIDFAYFKMSSDMKGYYWAFPKTDTEINVGWGRDDTSYDKYIPEYNDIIRKVCNIGGEIAIRGSAIEPKEPILSGGGRIPINTDYKDRTKYVNLDNSSLYVGDRACLVNPMLMGGEHLAMLSGQLAGYILANSNSYCDAAYEYYEAITHTIAPEMEMGIMANNMRSILSPNEFHQILGTLSIDYKFNDVMIIYIKRIMSRYMKIPETSKEELKDLL